MKKLIFLTLLLASCATQPRGINYQTWVCTDVYKSVTGYVHEFESLSKTYTMTEIFDKQLYVKNDTMKCYYRGRTIYMLR